MLIYHSREVEKLNQPRHCSKDSQPTPRLYTAVVFAHGGNRFTELTHPVRHVITRPLSPTVITQATTAIYLSSKEYPVVNWFCHVLIRISGAADWNITVGHRRIFITLPPSHKWSARLYCLLRMQHQHHIVTLQTLNCQLHKTDIKSYNYLNSHLKAHPCCEWDKHDEK